MAISKSDLIAKADYVNQFNNTVWNQIYSTIANVLYTENSSAGRTSDGINYAGLPRFNAAAYTGSNSLNGTLFANRPRAIPTGQISALSGDSDMVLTEADIEADTGLVTADVVYNACFKVLKAVTHIRPFKAYWQHYSNGAVNHPGFNIAFNNDFRYAVFRDTFTNPSNVGENNKTGTGAWGGGGALSYWVIQQGCTWAALQITEDSVPRNGCIKGSIIEGAKAAAVVTAFWRTWTDNCKGQNSFIYRYYSCHLNCHSNCHSNHSNRSRR